MFLVEHGVVKAIQVVEPHVKVAVRPALLVLHQQTYDSLVFKKEGLRERWARVLCEVQGCVFEFGLGLWMYPVTHASFARIRARASAPETMLTLPVRTSSRRLLASCPHALCAADFGSRLASRSSSSAARSSGGKAKTLS